MLAIIFVTNKKDLTLEARTEGSIWNKLFKSKLIRQEDLTVQALEAQEDLTVEAWQWRIW